MRILGLELSDAGILVARKAPAELLSVDKGGQESPGFALPEKKKLLTGKEAEEKAYLNPQQIMSHFWDQLNRGGGLKKPHAQAENLAEIAFQHLSLVWENVKTRGDECVIAVPGHFDREQLGLILGMTQELSIPLRGMASMAIAASRIPFHGHILLYLDIHLHRTEVTFLKQEGRLTQKDLVTIEGKGLQNLYAGWMQAIAEEFVRSTRFDPFYRAEYEQELYNRLPDVLAGLQINPTVTFDMTGGGDNHRVTLNRALFIETDRAFFTEIGRMISDLLERHREKGQNVTIQVAHRLHRLPGYREIFAGTPEMRVIELAPGAAGFGLLQLWDELPNQERGGSVSFFTSRPWKHVAPAAGGNSDVQDSGSREAIRPTHLLHRGLAYPISAIPLVVGSGKLSEGVGVRIENSSEKVSGKHCSVQLHDNEVRLIDHYGQGTFVNDIQVHGQVPLNIGDVIRVGSLIEKTLIDSLCGKK